LDIGESMVWWLASSVPLREAGDGLEVAPTGLPCWTRLSHRPVKRGAARFRRSFEPSFGAWPRKIWLWGQKRIQAELARLGFKVSARTVAKYMRSHRNRGPSPGWRKFLKQHAPNIWACDFFCVHTTLFQTLYVFLVIRLASGEVLHVEVTRLWHEF
jgi:hypothetical protein